MQIELEVAVGDVIHVGDHVLLVVEAQDGEVTFKICRQEEPRSGSTPRRLSQPR